MDAGQMSQILAQLQAGLVLLAPQPEQPRVITSALATGQTNTGLPIDYESPTGIKLWNEATAPLTFTLSSNIAKINDFSENLVE